MPLTCQSVAGGIMSSGFLSSGPILVKAISQVFPGGIASKGGTSVFLDQRMN